MPAKDKSALIAVTEKEWAKLVRLLADAGEDRVLEKDSDDTSIKDVIGHRAHWIDLFFGWYTDGQAGKEVHFPAPGYKWSDLKAYNSALRDKQAHLSWTDVQDMLALRHAQLLEFLHKLDNAELYGGPMQGAKNTWTTGRWAEATGASHYRSAAKYIRARLKDG